MSINCITLSVQLLKIRIAQIKRGYIPPLLIYLMLCVFVFYNSPGFDVQKSLVFAISTFFLIQQFHIKRSDLNFTKRYLNHHKLQIALNYNLIVLPITIGLCFVTSYAYSALIHFLVSSLPFIELSSKSKSYVFIGKIIPSAHFEWISGLRKNIYIILFILLFVLTLSPVKLFPIALLFLLNLIFMDFYSLYEPLTMLNPKNLSTKAFMDEKINFSCKVFTLINAPIIIINSFIHNDMITFNLLFFIGFMLMFINVIYIKYATYEPKETLRFHADQLLLTITAIVPYLIPISLYLLYSNRKKAYKNISNYLE
ncbi:MAG: hypothetical protein ACK50A_14515 [Sphingobacteriaceae bacterium]|jgi:hypothetical protein